MKRLIPLIAVAVVIFIIYKQSPGLQGKVKDIQDKVTGWSEEAKKNDPVAYLDHLEGELKKAQTKFTEMESTTASKVAEFQSKRDENQAKVDFATNLAEKFKVAYKGATENDQWPVEVEGKSYDRAQLIDQVEGLVFEKESISTLVSAYDSALEETAGDLEKVKTQAAKVDKELAMLSIKKETVKIGKATAEVDKIIAELTKTTEGKDSILELPNNPVRTLDQFEAKDLADKKKAAEAAAEAEKKQKTIDFLEG